MSQDNQRSHVRIHYPPARRPTLQLDGREYPVLDLSAEGLLFLLPPDAAPPTLGGRLEGTLRLRSCPPVAVRARIVWVEDDRVGLHLWPDAIPYSVLLSEERSLAANRGA
ncbi:MAG TPA: PilZ domain-containing protein [Gemmatimonadales bacterium]|nr:PilZ domain-containing protein [Gemmatimonadales bacterium]